MVIHVLIRPYRSSSRTTSSSSGVDTSKMSLSSTGRHPVDRVRRDVNALARKHLALHQLLALLNFEEQLPRPQKNRLVLYVVVLQAERVPGLHVQHFSHIPFGDRPVQLVPPGLVDFSNAQASSDV